MQMKQNKIRLKQTENNVGRWTTVLLWPSWPSCLSGGYSALKNICARERQLFSNCLTVLHPDYLININSDGRQNEHVCDCVCMYACSLTSASLDGLWLTSCLPMGASCCSVLRLVVRARVSRANLVHPAKMSHETLSFMWPLSCVESSPPPVNQNIQSERNVF